MRNSIANMRNIILVLLLSVIIIISVVYAQSQTLTVKTSKGDVTGQKAGDGDYYTFFGIFYGGDTSKTRFQAPSPPSVAQANESNIVCAQPSPNGLIGTENCLALNIFTNGTGPAKPVLVWLIGEEYTTSNGNPVTSFRKLVSEGVVVVQLNYRLSIFGFLCLHVAEAPGNAGLKDVVEGLKWIQKNIACFGGDVNNVILFGHGSAAAMVDLITLSPSARGYFHKAVTLSGSGLAPWAVAYEPIKYAHAFGNKLSYTAETNKRLAELLASENINVIVEKLNSFDFLNNTILFAPCIENPELNSTFLTNAPINILRSGDYSHVPYLTGYTNREGTIRALQAMSKGWLEKMQTNFSLFLQADLDFGVNVTKEEKAIREQYFSQSKIDMSTIEDFFDYQGDTLITVSVIRGAWERALTSPSEVRLLEFAYSGTKDTDWSFDQIPVKGARHGSILNYLLDYDLRNEDQAVMSSIIRRFGAFLKTGIPNPASNPGVAWSPVTRETLNYLLYSDSGQSVAYSEEAKEDPHAQEMRFWNNLYSLYYVAPKFSNSAGGLVSVVTLVILSQILHLV